ncbi:MAG: hypothetical protein R3E79_02670 [Caldilineaceae bacterium]
MNTQQTLPALPAQRSRLAQWSFFLMLPVLLFVVSGCIPIAAEEATPVPATPQTVPVVALAPPSARPGTTVFLSTAGWQPEAVLTLSIVSIRLGKR